MPAERSWTDKKIETAIARLLQGGVSLAAMIVFSGACIYLARHGSSPVDYRTFRGEPEDYRTLRGIAHNVATWHGRGMIQLGLLLLIATPIARVAFSIWGFFEERDRMYVVFTLIVLAVLLYSLTGSL